jgi:hypothetical protein
VEAGAMAYGQALKAEWDRQFRVIVAGLVLIVLIIMGGVALLTSTPDPVSTVKGSCASCRVTRAGSA